MKPLRILCCVAMIAVVAGCSYEPDVAIREGAPRINFVYEPRNVAASESVRDFILWDHFECVKAGVPKADPRFSIVEEEAFWQMVSPSQELIRWEEFLTSRGPPPTLHIDYVVALHAFLYQGGYGPSFWLHGAPAGSYALTERIVASASLMSIEEQKVVAEFEAEAVGSMEGTVLFIVGMESPTPKTRSVVCRRVVQTLIERLLTLTAGQSARLVFLPAKPG